MKTLDAASPTVKKLKNIRLSANKNMTTNSPTKKKKEINETAWRCYTTHSHFSHNSATHSQSSILETQHLRCQHEMIFLETIKTLDATSSLANKNLRRKKEINWTAWRCYATYSNFLHNSGYILTLQSRTQPAFLRLMRTLRSEKEQQCHNDIFGNN